jgi:putative cell wall-binding protein
MTARSRMATVLVGALALALLVGVPATAAPTALEAQIAAELTWMTQDERAERDLHRLVGDERLVALARATAAAARDGREPPQPGEAWVFVGYGPGHRPSGPGAGSGGAHATMLRDAEARGHLLSRAVTRIGMAAICDDGRLWFAYAVAREDGEAAPGAHGPAPATPRVHDDPTAGTRCDGSGTPPPRHSGPDTREVVRWSGADRYATALAISAETFPDGADTVFVATGEDFADALAAGTAAALRSAPVLLSPRAALPDAVAAELARLRPMRAVLVGGEAALSAAVERRVGEVVPRVDRAAGPNRYATAAALAGLEHPQGAEQVVVASGEGFADALAAAPAAEGPLLLVARDAVPAEVAERLAALDPDAILVAGGAAAVSEEVIAELRRRAPVERVAGADRWGTAAALAGRLGEAPTVLVASGQAFPDALAAGPAAAVAGGPLLLVAQDVLPEATRAALDAAAPARVVVLGGRAAVGDEVLDALR